MRADAAPSFLYVPELPEPDGTLSLSADEQHYLFRVCRARSGEEAVASDGRGRLARVRIEGDGPTAIVRVVAVEAHERARRCWICCGAPEGSRADWLVEKLAELGIERFQPVETSRGRWSGGASRGRRWERLATAAMRQSRQAWRMEVSEPVNVHELERSLLGHAKILADANGAPIAPVDAGGARETAVLVGPSGGLTDEERVSLIHAGWQAKRLSGSVLRTETAAMAAASLWAASWGVDGSRDRA